MKLPKKKNVKILFECQFLIIFCKTYVSRVFYVNDECFIDSWIKKINILCVCVLFPCSQALDL